MSRIVILIISVIVSIAFTAKAYFFNWDGMTTIGLFERLPLFFSTSKYTFLIWFFIFCAFFLWLHMNFKQRKTELFVTKVQTFLFVLVVFFQVTSLFQWHQENFYISLLLVCVQLLLLFLLYLTYPISNDYLKLRAPISIYFSWVTFDFLIKISYVLVYIEWNGFGLSNGLWAIIFMTIGVLISMHLRYHHFDIAFPLVFIWGYIGIILKYGFDEILVTAAALFLTGVMAFGTIYFKKDPKKLRV